MRACSCGDENILEVVVVVAAQQCDCTSCCNETPKMVKVVTFMACTFYHGRNKNACPVVLSLSECSKQKQLVVGFDETLSSDPVFLT